MTLPTLELRAIVHYRFEAIHPFADGNGRTGRAPLVIRPRLKARLIKRVGTSKHGRYVLR